MIGDEVTININGAVITLGRDVAISPCVRIYTANHRIFAPLSPSSSTRAAPTTPVSRRQPSTPLGGGRCSSGQSIGRNLLEGLDALQTADPARYYAWGRVRLASAWWHLLAFTAGWDAQAGR